jgi:hypothetical protein
MFPAALTQGLKVEIDTNIAKKALQIWSKAGFGGQEWSGVAGGPAGTAVYVAAETNFACESIVGGALGVAMTQINIYADALIPAAVSATNAAALVPANRARNVARGMTGASNLLIGRPIFAWTTGGALGVAPAPTYE